MRKVIASSSFTLLLMFSTASESRIRGAIPESHRAFASLVDCTKQRQEGSLATALITRLAGMLFTGIRAAISNAAKDASTAYTARSPAYAFSLSTERKEDGAYPYISRQCLVMAIGKPHHTAEIGIDPTKYRYSPEYVGKTATLAEAIRTIPVQKIPHEDLSFAVLVELEPSVDRNAFMARVKEMHYPRFIHSGRSRADRTLAIGFDIKLPNDKATVVAEGMIEVENLSPRRENFTAADIRQQSIWFPLSFPDPPNPIKAGDNERIESNMKNRSPVNIGVTVTETAAGSRFFKAVDDFLDESTTNTLKSEFLDAIVPGRTAAADAAAFTAHQTAISTLMTSLASYRKARIEFETACTALAEDQGASKEVAWNAWYTAIGAHASLEKAFASVPDYDRSRLDVKDTTPPVFCKAMGSAN